MEDSVELKLFGPISGRGPVLTGLPFPRGKFTNSTQLSLRDTQGKPVRVQARALDRWPDGSVRWALLDWIAEANAGPYRVTVGEPVAVDGPVVNVEQRGEEVVVTTGAARFELHTHAFPFARIAIDGKLALAANTGGVTLTDDDGAQYRAAGNTIEVESATAGHACVCIRGRIVFTTPPPGKEKDDEYTGKHGGLNTFTARLHFFAGSAITRIEFTIRNSRRAAHPGGLWDLGDAGSVFFQDVSLTLTLPAGGASCSCSPELGTQFEKCDLPFTLYQDSSGGENWRSANHLNRKHEIPLQFRGYKLKSGDSERSGLRATPIVTLTTRDSALGIAVPHFWQNFPQAIEATSDTLTLRFLPKQFADTHELQGGEQKTWTFALGFGPDANAASLEWFRTPVRAVASPEWYCDSGAIPYLTPKATDRNAEYLKLVDSAIEGAENFDAKREKIDEFGWRHFGEIYGDHEAVYHTGAEAMVSHYNNQYDPVAGFAVQFLRSGDLRWWRHMEELATHVIDIDIYHATQDKSAYNGGLFWHTYHYAAADTGTHRSYPRALLQMKSMPGLDPNSEKAKRSKHVYAAGGGPANEHNYATGFMLHYFLTGSVASREAAIGLAQWVIDMDDGNKTIFRYLSRADTGRASMSRDESYHGPGRGSGNSLSALIDGHRLTGDSKFLAKAEQLVRRCIHPSDNVPRRNFLDVENRWFYTMFLQSLGKYLDYKAERGELDSTYAYARASLLHYARWMAEHEVPTLSRPEILEYPNETWAAQDMRKSEVLKYAAKHATGDEKAKFLERADFFFRDSVSRLTAFPTRTLARPVVLLLSYGYMHAHFQQKPEEAAPVPSATVADFGTPTVFVPQKVIAKKRAKMLAVAGAACGLLALAALVALVLLK